MYARVVSVLSNSGTGTQNITFTGGTSFTPKAAIVQYSRASTSADAFNQHVCRGYGFTDGTTSRCIAFVSEDAVTNTDTASLASNNSIITTLAPSGTVNAVDAVATFTSWITDGMQITWSDAPAAQFYIHVMFLGGSDLTNAAVGTLASGTTTTPVSVTGLSFQPDFGMFMAVRAVTASENTAVVNAMVSIGAATSSSAQWSQTYWHPDNLTSSAPTHMHSHDRCLLSLASTLEGYTTFTSFNSDGFTLTPTDALFINTPIYYLVLKGGDYSVGNNTEPGSTGDQTTTVSKDVKGVMIFGTDGATANTSGSGAMWTSGMGTSSSEQGCEVSDEINLSDPTTTANIHDTDQIYLNITANATHTSSTLDDEATLSAVSSTSFTLNWSNIGSALPFRYITFGGAITSNLYPVSITESSISVSDSNARVLLATRSQSESSIAVSDSNTRLFTAFRSSSESSIAISDSNVRTKIGVRSISESSISVSDALARLLTAKRTLTESSIAVSESVARLLTAKRTLTESTVTVSDTVSGNKGYFKTISEAAVSVSDSLTRIAILSRSLTESTINVSDSNTRIKTQIRTIAETAISVSDALARKLNAFRTISESTISVSESLARLLTAIRTITESTINISDTVSRSVPFTRAISEAAIAVSDSLFSFGKKIRAVSEASITVSDSLARMTTLLRTISESTINVTDSLARIKIALRTLSEAAISVSETLTRLVPFTRTLSEASISVSESLARLLTAIRTRTETTIAVSDSVVGINTPLKSRFITETVLITEQLDRLLKAFRTLPTEIISVLPGTVNAFIVPPVMATVIMDPGYSNDLRLLVKFIDRKISSKIHYEYNSYFPSERPFNLLSCSVRLAQGEVGAFSMEIEDHLKEVDADNIGFNSKIQIFVKKELGGQWVQLMTGYVRRVQKVRSTTDTLMYRINGYGTQIVFNERITDFKRAAKKSAVDSIDPLPTDSTMFANNLFSELITATDILPLRGPSLASQAGFTLDAISPEVSDFIAAVAPGLTDASAVANAFAELTGAIWGVNSEGNPYFRYPTQKHSGIIIKDDPQDTDSAFNTSINMGSFDYEDTIDLAEGFANRLYVLNAVDTKSTASSSKSLGSTTLTFRGIAQQFVSTDNNISGAAFILSRVGNPISTTNAVFGKLRADNNGYPNGATLATFEIPFSSIDTSKSTIFVNDIKPAEGTINPGQKYWWFLGAALGDDTNTIRWHHDNDQVTIGRFSATLPLVDADPTKAGDQLVWIRSDHGPVYAFSTFSSIRHILEHSDPESIANYGLIEGIVDLPAFEDDATFQKALVQILRTSSRPKRIYEHQQVTIPTQRLFFPGELVTLIDSKANLTAQKNVTAEIAEVLYNFNADNNAMGCKYVDIRCIGFVDKILDDYLNTAICTED